jgi:hypothetical protein
MTTRRFQPKEKNASTLAKPENLRTPRIEDTRRSYHGWSTMSNEKNSQCCTKVIMSGEKILSLVSELETEGFIARRQLLNSKR